MKSISKIYLVLIIMFAPVFVFSQDIALKRADKFYEDLEFTKAVDIYEILDQKYPNDFHIIQHLAYSYLKMGDYENAFKQYSSLVSFENSSADDWFQYAQLLKVDGKYTEAKKWFEKYLLKVEDDQLTQSQLEKLSLWENMKDGMSFKVIHTKNNSKFTDMCPVILDDKLIFSSSRDSFSIASGGHYWNGQPFLDLYSANFDKTKISDIEEFSKKLNSKVHEGPVTFSKNGETIFFTRNNYAKNKRAKNSKKLNNLKIFISEWNHDHWGKEYEFPFNSDEYSVGHPALSNDGQTLYFVSDMPGGFGKTDIYKSKKTKDGWSKPTNLGEKINTREKEMFPTIDKNDNLFFSSTGHLGLGGLDVFVAINDGNVYLIQNLGNTFNSSYDDFSLTFNNNGKNGYFTSNRPGGKGNDDIYYFELEGIELSVITRSASTKEILPNTKITLSKDDDILISQITNEKGEASFNVNIGDLLNVDAIKEKYFPTSDSIDVNYSAKSLKKELFLKQENRFKGLVIDKETQQIIPSTIIMVESGDKKQSLISNNVGNFSFEYENGTSYKLSIKADNYLTHEAIFSSKKDYFKSENIFELIALKKGTQFVLENIYFDLNKWDIREDAAIELDKLVSILKKYPNLEIHLGSHTDSRGSDSYNMWLSCKRAESSYEYIVAQGISSKRMTFKGYGETQLVNKCRNEIQCSDEDHQKNRRTVVEITKDQKP